MSADVPQDRYPPDLGGKELVRVVGGLYVG
jgi:hypothetical protein